MQRFVARLRQIDGDLPFWQRMTSERARDAMAAALLHDVGHGPLSHLFEGAMPGASKHERLTTRILLDPDSEVHGLLSEDDPSLPHRVADLVMGVHELPYLANAVSGIFDVDRCDYLLRDARATGVTYGDYDLPWLLRSLRFEPTEGNVAPGLAIDGMKGITAIESFLLARLFMFQQVYFHKSTRAAETMIGHILRRAVQLVEAGEPIPARLPALEAAAAGRAPTLHEYLELDDQVLLTAIHAWEEAKDPVLSDLCKRLRARALFKTFEVGIETDVAADEALAIAVEVARARSLDPAYYVSLDRAIDTPYPAAQASSSAQGPAGPHIESTSEGRDLRVIFPDGRARDLGDVSFILARLRGQTLERTRLVFAAELRDDLRGALLR
jgi:hypothetical protein